MSSTSSVCSSNDADLIIDTRIPAAIRRDVERFSMFANRLRTALDVTTNVSDGESMCVSVHSALEMVSESMRDLFKYEQFKTNHVILPSLQLVQSVKDLKFDSCLVDTSCVHQILDQLESAVLNTIIQRHVRTSPRFSTLQRRSNKSVSSGVVALTKSATLQRRHSAFHDDAEEGCQTVQMDRILCSRSDGIDVAFERTKAWSNYCKELLAYVRARLQLEQDHARRVNALVETSRSNIAKPYMGLHDVWETSFDCDMDLMTRTRDTAEHLKDRFVEALDARRKEHDAQRNALKMEWTKVCKAVTDCEEAYEKARASLRLREEGQRKAREQCMRTESLPQAVTSDLLKRRRDLEKRKRAEEEAVAKREEAGKQVAILATELRRKRKEQEKTKERLIEKLRELVFQCDQTTKACSSHYFKALATLWVKLPGGYQELADATRDFEPGSAYMAFLQQLPQRAASSTSLLRSDRSVDEGVSCDGSSVASLRRNAINPEDEGALPDTKRHKKTSTAGRLYDALELSDAAQSHCVQRTVQPSKCSHCDKLSLVFTVQCIDCQQFWHRNCFPKTPTTCGTLRSPAIDRRMSIFGVPLRGLLEQQHRTVPLILEATIDELQSRGLRLKGIYRTCGVKSKIEEICEAFERNYGSESVDLSHVHPMNLASVIKLYLRKLPEPLLTHELYSEWVRIGTQAVNENEETIISDLRKITRKLPPGNYDTLRHIMLHLNRVTWFEESNLMGCSNLSTVVAPSLLWPPSTTTDHSVYLQQAQNVNAAVQELIRHAFIVFAVDRDADWEDFFNKYSMEKPPRDDDGNESDVEDINEKDGIAGDIDDDPIFLPQPPTPDLLKTALEAKSSDASWQSSPEDRPRRLLRREKRRSYTTSIIITPDARPVLRQRSAEDSPNNDLCSGDVTLDVGHGTVVVLNQDSSSSIGSGCSAAAAYSLRSDLRHANDDVSYV